MAYDAVGFPDAIVVQELCRAAARDDVWHKTPGGGFNLSPKNNVEKHGKTVENHSLPLVW